MERLIIFGGAFDPIHNGHLRLAQAASLLLNADVVFVPAKSPRWKKTQASAKDRLKMLKLALSEKGSGSFSLSDVELKRDDEVTYTIDTVRYFKNRYPQYEILLLMGEDQVERFPNWEDADLLSNMANIYYVTRNNREPDPRILQRYNIKLLNFSGAGNVSSSAIRNLQSLDMPGKVLNYIEKEKLYYMKELGERLDEKRLEHSLSVAHLAMSIASRNRLEIAEKAYIAGILHDLAKGMSIDESKKRLEDENPELLKLPSYTWHQFLGASLAREIFKIEDQEILDAISYHCTGKKHMSPLAKIIFSADKIDPLRGYDSSRLIRACYSSYYLGFLKVLKENREYLKEKGQNDDNVLTQECYSLYLGD